MIPSRVHMSDPNRSIRLDRTCRETGPPVHQNGEPSRTGGNAQSVRVPLSVIKTTDYENVRSVAAEHGSCILLSYPPKNGGRMS